MIPDEFGVAIGNFRLVGHECVRLREPFRVSTAHLRERCQPCVRARLGGAGVLRRHASRAGESRLVVVVVAAGALALDLVERLAGLQQVASRERVRDESDGELVGHVVGHKCAIQAS
jgi:hypothetical protein